MVTRPSRLWHTDSMNEKPLSAVHRYQIVLEGCLDDHWADWFAGLTMSHNNNITILTGPITDQAALRGLLNRIWDFNLAIMAIRRLD